MTGETPSHIDDEMLLWKDGNDYFAERPDLKVDTYSLRVGGLYVEYTTVMADEGVRVLNSADGGGYASLRVGESFETPESLVEAIDAEAQVH